MPSRPRTSLPNTRSGKGGDSESSDAPVATVTPRKTPHCTKCQRPRAGHPRSGCPFTDSPTSTSSGTPRNSANDSDKIATAMGSMYLEPSTPTADTDRTAAAPHSRNRSTAATPLVPSETLASLSGSSLDIVEKLLQPGVFDSEEIRVPSQQASPGKKVLHWQETLLVDTTPTKSHKPKARILMPGTLNTPSPNTSLGTTHNTSRDTIAPVPSGTPPLPSDERLDVSQTPSANLARTMSAAEREAFISTLASTSKATIHLLHKADLAEALTSATNFGFHARIVMNNDESDAHGFLILGRDEPKVLELTRRVENESRNATNNDGSERETGGALRAAAGGVVLGAVGAWAGLAFS